MNYLSLDLITMFLLCISISALFMYNGKLTSTVFISINGLVYHQSVLPVFMEVTAPVDVMLTVQDQTTLVIMSAEHVSGVMLDITGSHVLINAAVTVLDQTTRVTVTLGPVSRAVILDITETNVSIPAT